MATRPRFPRWLADPTAAPEGPQAPSVARDASCSVADIVALAAAKRRGGLGEVGRALGMTGADVMWTLLAEQRESTPLFTI